MVPRIGNLAEVLAWRALLTIWFMAAPPAAHASDRRPDIIDDFEGSATLQRWRFSSSAQGGAATGEIKAGPGHRGTGAVLSYQLLCEARSSCDARVAAVWRPARPLPKRRNPAISLWVRFPADVDLFLAVTDSRGQTLQFPIGTSLERIEPGEWQYVVTPLSTRSGGDQGRRIKKELNGQIVEIAVSAGARDRQSVQGSVSFDDVRWRDSQEIFQVGAAVGANGRTAQSMELERRLGVNIHVLGDNRALDRAHAVGFGFVRMDLLWSNVERGGRYRFFGYDALLRSLEVRGMGALLILDYGHPNHGGSTPRAPADVAAFGRFAEAAAAHFKGRNVRYEIWNEPDTSQFWTPAPNASEYTALLREAVAGILRADPGAKISSGGVSRFDEQFLREAITPDLSGQLSAIAVHPYPKTGPETIVPDLVFLRDKVARRAGPHLEIWDTEWGYSSSASSEGVHPNGHDPASRMRQAELAVREILTVVAVDLPLAVWYDLRDDGPDGANPEQNYGLLDSEGEEKPAMQAIRRLLASVRGYKYAGLIQETPAGMHAMRFEGTADTKIIVWTDQAGVPQTVEYPEHDLISASGLMGEILRSKHGHGGMMRVNLNEGAGPIYLTFRTGSGR
jgi:hypothetical protein